MNTYDPLKAPDPDAWLSMDESERIELVSEHHRHAGTDLPNEQLHAVVHAIVENQIAEGEEIPTRATLDRLMEEGLDRHEAIHAIGGVLTQFMFDLVNDDVATANSNEKYYQELERLTAAEWLESFN